MSDQKISELNAITGINTADDDLFVIVDTSAGETKKILKSELVSTINAALVDGAPATLDTLNELAAALADDANFATTVTNSLAGKVDTSGDTMTGDLNFGDNDKAVFGAGSDLQIYHDPATNDSFIKETGGGSLKLFGTHTYIANDDGTQTLARFIVGGESALYNANFKRLATTSTGIDVTGTATMDGSYIQATPSVGNDSLTLGFTAPNGSIKVKNSSGSPAANLDLHTTDASGNTRLRQRIGFDGNVSLYEDTGTTAKFFWDASAESLGIGTSSPSATLHTYKNSVNAYNLFQGSAGSWVFGQADSKCQVGGLLGTHSGMTVDTVGNVGIGTSSPAYLLDAKTTGSPSARIRSDDAGGTATLLLESSNTFSGTSQAYIKGIGTAGSGLSQLSFGTAGSSGDTTATERMRIDSSGNVGIGTDSPDANNVVTARSAKGTSTEIAGYKASNANNIDLIVGVTGHNYTGGITSANYPIIYTPDNFPIVFGTNNTERMRIDSSGNLLVGWTGGIYADPGANSVEGVSLRGTTAYKPTVIVSKNDSESASNFYSYRLGNSSQGKHMLFHHNGTTVGTIVSTTTSTSYNTSSDYRLKEDWQPVANASDRVAQLKPVNFAWKNSGDRVDGFLAHELAEVIPEAVTGTKDAMRTEEYEVSPAVLDDEGNVVTEAVMGEREVPDYQGIDQSKLVPLLTAALQEALTEIDNLKARLDAAGL